MRLELDQGSMWKSESRLTCSVLAVQIEWEIGRKLAGMGWTEAEELCTVLQDGTVSYYTLHGETGGERAVRCLCGRLSMDCVFHERSGQKLFDREFRLFDAGTPARITEAIVRMKHLDEGGPRLLVLTDV